MMNQLKVSLHMSHLHMPGLIITSIQLFLYTLNMKKNILPLIMNQLPNKLTVSITMTSLLSNIKKYTPISY